MNENLRRLLRGTGIEVTRFPAPETLPWQLRHLLAHRPVDAVIDVGAHEGEFARLMREVVGFRGQIVSFEPSYASFEMLTQAMAGDAAWSGRRMALGAAAESLVLNVYPATVFNSFRMPNSLGHEMFTPELASQTTETVALRRLDEVLDMPGQLLLKVDTQGYDLEVLAGASGVMHRVQAVVLELPVRPIYDGAPDLGEMLGRMTDAGFELLGLYPVTRDTDYFRVIEFDGVFVRDNSL